MSINKKIRRPVLRYHGGKFLLAEWIVSHFPKHRIYVEPFGGGGSVLMRKHRSYAEIYNDRWDNVVNVFQVLRDDQKSEQLRRVLELTPYSRTEFRKCSYQNFDTIDDPIERARLTIYRSFSGFGSAATNGQYATGFRGSSHRSGTTPAQDWANFPQHVKLFNERLKGVTIENLDYREVMLRHDTPETLVYLDPPYVHATRNMKRGNASYAHEFADMDHVELCQFIKGLKSMIILSGYENDIYDENLVGWRKEHREALADGAKKRIETLWFSPNCPTTKGKIFE
jgi:DNA adenine methylase